MIFWLELIKIQIYLYFEFIQVYRVNPRAVGEGEGVKRPLF